MTDHLGSVRGVSDSEGHLLFRTHYYPYGSEYGYETGGISGSGAGQDAGLETGSDGGVGLETGEAADQPYRYNGKEDQGFAGVPALDYGARLYSAETGRWLSQDPLGEEYYWMSPYVYCAGNPVDFVDPEGMAWYYNASNGAFVVQTNDSDDKIYLLNDEQIKAVEAGKELNESFKSDENMFGQMILEGTLTDVSIIGNVIVDLFNRANHTEENGDTRLTDADIDIIINMNTSIIKNGKPQNAPKAQISPESQILEVFPVVGGYFEGYGSMLILVHELGHFVDYENNRLSDSENTREQSADKFVKAHWAYKKASVFMRDKIVKHFNQEGGKVL